MKSGKVLKWVAAAAAVCAALFLGAAVWNNFSSSFSLTTIARSTTEDALTISGYLVRDELLLEETSGLYAIEPNEGEKIGKGQLVATVYSTPDALELQQQLEQLLVQKSQLEYAEAEALGVETSMRLDAEIQEQLLQLRSALSSGDSTESDSLILSLRELFVQLDYAGGTDTLGDTLTSVNAEIQTIQAQLLSGSTSILSPAAGYYSAVVDGYESLLTPETVLSMTPAELSALTPRESAVMPVGKLILRSTWYFAAVVEEEAALRLEQTKSVTLRFSGMELTSEPICTLVSLSEADENGQRVAVLSCRNYLAEMTQLRQTTATLVFDSHTGLRVPKQALRVDENSQVGVYCLVGLTARFKPVSILYSGEDYYLVEPDVSGIQLASLQETLRLRSGDQAIISAEKLYDRKVIF